MQSACSDGDGISKKDFMKFWDELDTDRSGALRRRVCICCRGCSARWQCRHLLLAATVLQLCVLPPPLRCSPLCALC